MIQFGCVYATFCQEEGILLPNYRDRNGRCTAIPFKSLVARAICNAIRANRFARIAIETPIFIARQADSHESLEFPIRANHSIRANRANRFALITQLSSKVSVSGVGLALLNEGAEPQPNTR